MLSVKHSHVDYITSKFKFCLYGKLIKTATEKLANVREDVKTRDKELIDNPEFSITIGKATYTERVDGGTMMLEAISKCKTGETTAIGKFHGLELLVEKNFLGMNRITYFNDYYKVFRKIDLQVYTNKIN